MLAKFSRKELLSGLEIESSIIKFTNAILKGEAIDVYNYGEMSRDFTYIDDLVKGIRLLIDAVPQTIEINDYIDGQNNGESPVAPYRCINIGNSKPTQLIEYIQAIEYELGIKAKKRLLPMQLGDVAGTASDSSQLQEWIEFKPNTTVKEGIKQFIKWYKEFYGI